MLLSETSKPSLSSSPWIFGAPQPGFSCARRRIRSCTSLEIFGLPGRGRDLQRQYSRKPARCHAMTVSGLSQGEHLERVVSAGAKEHYDSAEESYKYIEHQRSFYHFVAAA